MFVEHAHNRSVYFSIMLLLLSATTLTACGGSAATAPPAASATQLEHTVKLTISTVNLQEGKETAILVEIQPYETLDWIWEVSGTSGGSLNTNKGENVIYKAGKAGIDTVTARGQLADGTPLKQSININVEAPATEVALATETALPPKVTLTTPQNEQKVVCENLASGTYPLDVEEAIWPIVYINGRFYPQDEGGKSAKKVEGKWYQTVRFGDCTKANVDTGEQFQLIIVTANQTANAAFEEYFTNAQETGDWGGMIELPASGVEEQLRIIVTRE